MGSHGDCIETRPSDTEPVRSGLLLSLTGSLKGRLDYDDSRNRYAFMVESLEDTLRMERSILQFSNNGLPLKRALGRHIDLQFVVSAIDLPELYITTELAREGKFDRPSRDGRHNGPTYIPSPPDNVLALRASAGASVSIQVSPAITKLVIYADEGARVSVTVLPRPGSQPLLSVCLIAARDSVICASPRNSVVTVTSSVIFSGQASSISGFFPVGRSHSNRVYTKDSGLVAFTAIDGTPSCHHLGLSHTQFKWCYTEWRENAASPSSETRREPSGAMVALLGIGRPFAFPALHGELVRRALGVSAMNILQGGGGDGNESSGGEEEIARAIAASLTDAPATGRKKVLQEKVEKPILFLRPDPGSDDEGVEEDSKQKTPKDSSKKKRKTEDKKSAAPEKTPVKPGEQCVICLRNEKTHWSVGCAHLLYCDHCAHKVASGNEWKVCPLCNTPSRGITFKPI